MVHRSARRGTALDVRLAFWDREAARRSLDLVLGWDSVS
jgi:hypothetical protein